MNYENVKKIIEFGDEIFCKRLRDGSLYDNEGEIEALKNWQITRFMIQNMAKLMDSETNN